MNEIIAGLTSGIAQTIIGHPLDTIKVLIQNKQPIKKLNLRNLYNGWRYPLAISMLFNGSVFPINNYFYKKNYNHYISGFITGMVVSPLVYTFDIGKIKQQTNQKIKFTDFYKTKGISSTIVRESLATSLYFGSYHFCKSNYNMDAFVAGGIAGFTNWTITYPIDVIRSRQIAQNISFIKAYNQKNLWNGYKICIIRAVIVNASVFKVYDVTNRYLVYKSSTSSTSSESAWKGVR